MNVVYIKVPRIYKKLKEAEESGCPLYLSVPIGYGKTVALEYFFRKKKILRMSGMSGKLDTFPEIDQIRHSTIVIDDVTWIMDAESKEYIKKLLFCKDKKIVMSGRAKMPEWLKSSCIKRKFILADRKDLELDEVLTEKLLNAFGIELSAKLVRQICNDTKGHALCTLMIAYQMQNKKNYTEAVREAARLDVFQYFNEAMYDKWPKDMRDLLLAVSNFDTFQVELAEKVTGQTAVLKLLYRAMAIGDFLIKHEDGTFEMLSMLRAYLLWKQSLKDNQYRQREVFQKAALFFEQKEMIQEALFYYDQVDDTKAITRLLIKNAMKHPGSGHYYETKKYYLNLPEQLLNQSPILISGMSMLYSLLMQPAKSEYWYDQLKKMEKKPGLNGNLKKEIRRRIIYLDIALPHRGTVTMVDILKNVAVFLTDRQMTIPEVSLTSNLPSILNGGKDFCEWTKSDRELARVLKKPVELILGKWGVGIVNISLAESLFEKGEQDYYEIMTLLNSGYAKADIGGKIEMCFVASAILCRLHICRNQLKIARTQVSELVNKVVREGAKRLLPNIYALVNWFDLLEGRHCEIEQWLSVEAPNELQDFYILNRYQYQMKIRSFLALGRNEEAANLIERLSVYFKEYHRTYMDMENEVLKAIVQYRMKLGDWKETLKQVLIRIEEYHFLFLIAKEGNAVLPLLKQLDPLPVEELFEAELLEMTQKMAFYYPDYLKVKEVLAAELTDAEHQILRYYCQGIEAKKICEMCHFTYNTLKFHNRNLYHKLGVNNRAEAERKAKELGL